MRHLLSRGIPTLASSLALLVPTSAALANEAATTPPPTIQSGAGFGSWVQPGVTNGYMLGELRSEQGKLLFEIRGSVKKSSGLLETATLEGRVDGELIDVSSSKVVGRFSGTWKSANHKGRFSAQIRPLAENVAPVGWVAGAFRIPTASTSRIAIAPTKLKNKKKTIQDADIKFDADVERYDANAPSGADRVAPQPAPEGALVMSWQLDQPL